MKKKVKKNRLFSAFLLEICLKTNIIEMQI
uniref:Uncharacterized protein n=1 Tax=Podoviridae sp. cttxo15 TaxID=2826584 RepID=A0A8S5N1H8_9CAUD|nr:MAG TPA: hypothetical protein [Podoviridae sp. cttxo15]